MNYDYSIAGFTIRLETPEILTVTEESVGFLCPAQAEAPDLILSFSPVEELPGPPESGIWITDSCYCQSGDVYEIYRCKGTHLPPYARMQWKRSLPGRAECHYLVSSGRKVSFTRNVLNIMSLETVLLMFGTLMLHASFIQIRGYGILFTAPSGTGKSTQADLWAKYENARILNGDRAALRCSEQTWAAWGLPFAGTSGIYRNESAPISAIVVLRQAKQNAIRRLTQAEAMRYIYAELTIHRWESEAVENAVELLLNLLASVPVFLLECLPDKGAVETLKQALLEGGIVL